MGAVLVPVILLIVVIAVAALAVKRFGSRGGRVERSRVTFLDE